MKKCYMITLNSAREPVLEFLNRSARLELAGFLRSDLHRQ